MEHEQKLIVVIVIVAFILCCGYCYQKYTYHVITVGNQPGMCENDGDIHAFIYDAYGKGEYRGNWSQVKNFLIYQHNKYDVNSVIDSPTLGSGRSEDIGYSLDEYIRMKDSQCGNGSALRYGLDILDPGLNPAIYTPTIVPTTVVAYDYATSQFGKVEV